jgi:hypothetical protein
MRMPKISWHLSKFRMLIIMAIAALILFCIAGRYYQKKEAGIAHYNIRRIHLGMSREDVVLLLGAPSHETSDIMEYRRTWTSWHSFSTLWVHLNMEQVQKIYGKSEGRLWGEEGVYVLRNGVAWESIDFETAFP